MIPLQHRIELLEKLGNYIKENSEEWQQVKELATRRNSWFDESDIDFAANNIANYFLNKELLEAWVNSYPQPTKPKNVGIVMAGNIPLVGFHDFLCGFVSGHTLHIKLSSKDDVLLKHLVSKLTEWQPNVAQMIHFAENLKGCDAYIATGSNNTARYFEQYFGKYPNIIRKNRTSVGVLNGNETTEELNALGKDIFTYYGLGCRNVTKVFLPEGYNLQTLLNGLNNFSNVIHHHKYKNNYDYQLAIYLLNKVPYQTNDFLLMVENAIPFSAVSVLHYEFYPNKEDLIKNLHASEEIQCIVDNTNIKYGNSQIPLLTDYADGVDTMLFMTSL